MVSVLVHVMEEAAGPVQVPHRTRSADGDVIAHDVGRWQCTVIVVVVVVVVVPTTAGLHGLEEHKGLARTPGLGAGVEGGVAGVPVGRTWRRHGPQDAQGRLPFAAPGAGAEDLRVGEGPRGGAAELAPHGRQEAERVLGGAHVGRRHDGRLEVLLLLVNGGGAPPDLPENAVH